MGRQGHKKTRKINRSAWPETRRDLLEKIKQATDQSSWEDFYRLYWRAIYNYASSLGLSRTEVEDVVQEVFIKIFRKIRALEYDPKRGRFMSWVKQVTKTTVIDHFRRKQARLEGKLYLSQPGGDPQRALNSLPAPQQEFFDRLFESGWEKSVLIMALDNIKSRIHSTTYQAFLLYALENQPAKEVANTLKIKVGQVYVKKNRVIRLIQEEIRQMKEIA